MKLKYYFLLFGFCISLTLISHSAFATCSWTVSGYAKYYDDFFVTQETTQSKGIKNATIKIWASTIPSGGWRYWGSDVLDEQGNYSITKTPAQSDPIGCDLRRRFKVKVYLDHDKARIVNPGLQTRTILISNLNQWKTGPNLTINRTFSELIDTSRGELSGDYVDTRAAQLFVGYQDLFDFFDDLELDPIKHKAVWPDGAGDLNYEQAWSPPGGYVRIPKSEYWLLQNNQWEYVGDFHSDTFKAQTTKLQKVETQIHELLHQWFNTYVYTPSFASGSKPYTHEFYETPAVSLYEAIPVAYSVQLRLLWSNGYISPTVSVPYNVIFSDVLAAPKMGGGTYEYQELRDDIDNNTAEWQEILQSAELTIKSFLQLIIRTSWYHAFLGNDYVNSNLLIDNTTVQITSNMYYTNDITKDYDCSELPQALFTPQEILKLLMEWKTESPGNTVPESERNSEGFYEFLKTMKPEYSEYIDILWQFYNPHYAGERLNLEICPEAQEPKEFIPLRKPKKPRVQIRRFKR
ncbi:MAG: hypothetical protein ABII18_02485 [bacterium]|nr:hypothetical protein [bacterium]MBU1917230.1 hypothetical protein [bacterium]